MARLGRRQPFPPIINKGLIRYQPAVAPVASKPFVVSSVRINHRPVTFTHVINNGLIRFQVSSPPVASRPFIVSFGATESRNPHRPFFFPVIIRGLIRYQPAPVTAPIPRRSYVISQISHDEAARRVHVLARSFSIVTPNVPLPVPRVRPKIKIKHDETLTTSRGRGHEQQIAKIMNELARSGQVIGSVSDPSLGYVADDPQAVGTTEPLTVKETLDRIIAALKALNGTGI